MNFTIRAGFVAIVETSYSTPEGRTEVQQTRYHGGQRVNFDEVHAMQHAHKLEPVDDEAAAWLEALHQPAPNTLPFGLTADQLQALTQQIAVQLAMQQRAAAAA